MASVNGSRFALYGFVLRSAVTMSERRFWQKRASVARNRATRAIGHYPELIDWSQNSGGLREVALGDSAKSANDHYTFTKGGNLQGVNLS